MNGPYDDIINLPHHVSNTHPQMPMQDRAAQFSPFAALSGYEETIKEAGRLVDEQVLLSEEELSELDAKFRILSDCLYERPEVTFTYFIPDYKKDGGSYVTETKAVKKTDLFARKIILDDGTSISMDNILNMDSEIFEDNMA